MESFFIGLDVPEVRRIGNFNYRPPERPLLATKIPQKRCCKAVSKWYDARPLSQ